jgi:hypothetical protein
MNFHASAKNNTPLDLYSLFWRKMRKEVDKGSVEESKTEKEEENRV